MKNNLYKFLPVLIFGIFFPTISFGASLNFSQGGTFSLGQTFQVHVLVSTEASKPLNAVSAAITFPKDKLEIVSVTKTGSIINFWAEEPKFSNFQGTVNIEGVVLNPGWSGTSGRVATINFKVKGSGAADLTFASASVLANDGYGTNILTSAIPASISLNGESVPVQSQLPPGSPSLPQIKSDTHPDQNIWYKNNSPKFSWKLPGDVVSVRLLYDKSPNSIPTVEYSPAINNKELKDLADGTYYLHVQFKNDKGWGAVSHFKFQIDKSPPSPFEISLAHSEITEDPRPILYFNTSDDISGISKYVVKVGEREDFVVLAEEVSSNPYSPPNLDPGENIVMVTAYDKAGNVRTEQSVINVNAIDPPQIEEYPSHIDEGDLLRIRGKSYPDSTVRIFLKDDDDIVTEETAKTNTLGNFGIIWTKHLEKGVYSFTVTVEDNKGAKSFPVGPFTFEVRTSALSRYSSSILNYVSIGVLAVALVFFLLALVFYLNFRLKKFKNRIYKRFHNAEHAIDHDFGLLKEELEDHMSVLEEVKSKRNLTKEEKMFMSKFKKYIDMVEKDINIKLSAVEDELDK